MNTNSITSAYQNFNADTALGLGIALILVGSGVTLAFWADRARARRATDNRDWAAQRATLLGLHVAEDDTLAQINTKLDDEAARQQAQLRAHTAPRASREAKLYLGAPGKGKFMATTGPSNYPADQTEQILQSLLTAAQDPQRPLSGKSATLFQPQTPEAANGERVGVDGGHIRKEPLS